MTLSPQDHKRFFHIWWPLLKYVNSHQKILENFPENPLTENVSVEDAAKIRNVLWNSPDLLDDFIRANPAQLAEAELQLTASWKNRFSGQFVIMRHLKKHSVFLRFDEQPTAFGVLGIISPLQDVVGHSLPVMVDAVLLPFEGKIIYDSIISPHLVSFGPGIRNRLNQTYRQAQELCGVLTSLNADDRIKVKMDAVAKSNRQILFAFRNDLADTGLSEKMTEQHYYSAESFVKSSLLQTNPPRSLATIQVSDVETYLRQQGKKANRVSLKRLVRFLYSSARIDSETASALEDFLKNFNADESQ